jgi:hypothetical protein
VVTQSRHAAELLRRLPDLPLIGPPAESAIVADDLGLDGATQTEPGPSELAALAWVEPFQSDVAELERIGRWLKPSGRLYLVAGGRLSRFLAERRVDHGSDYLSGTRAKVLLKENGFHVLEQIGLHGPRAITWHSGGVILRQFSRPAMSDQAHFAMRRDFVEAGLGRHLAALTLISAEHTQ